MDAAEPTNVAGEEAPTASSASVPAPPVSVPSHQPEQQKQGQQPIQDARPSTDNRPPPLQPPPLQPPPAASAAAPPAAAPQRRPHIAPRDKFNYQSLGASLNSSVKQARVLMVGAGGIGCELLKNLVLTGFGEIHIVDLDTIDLSNLNRQFLFRHEHIKKSKAHVAKEAAQKFNPKVQIIAHHANIKDSQFNVSWFRGFRLVFNALDNLEARRHVNKMCLAADVPLVESGTTGFNGQVQVIKKGVTACYDCSPKEAPKSFPVCTIRSTPSQPIHCIVWAKSYLLNEIFGTSEDQAVFDHSEDSDNADEIEELKRESQALKTIREAVGTPEFPRMLFDKVFNSDIERLRSVEGMWKSRKAPEPLSYETVLSQAKEAADAKQTVLADDQKVWDLEENLVVFNDSLERLSARLLELEKNGEANKDSPNAPGPVIAFDKDDQDTLDFVVASANIRSTIFGIERKSRFDTKQMAGNIIPAIATTNAIVAGLCVLQAFKVLKGEYSQAKEVFLTPFVPARLLAPDRSREPNPDCPVCSVYNTTVTVDPTRTTLNDIVEDFLKEHLGLGEKDFVLNNDVGVIYDPDETDNLPKKLSELNISGGSFLTVIDDDDEDTWVNIVVSVEEGSFGDDEKPLRSASPQHPDVPRKPKKAAPPAPVEANGRSEVQKNGDSEVVTIIEDEVPAKGAKRSHPGEDSEQSSKKAKRVKAGGDDDDVVAIEDGGAIVIGDD
ncbi:ubiquitin-like 1-activating enzyme E1 B [Geosmithia morbida]|uniref:Ubiquitin-like 1-activating enzyme E1 B n=1 Tax=Geosmithia morbida TaxID=1094350 RepID=A0A9P4Z1D6_9HYPO|nr:ubiquitin-like 1-activating enzyme E1 B [Geosmithia morbida]KAF4126342.1 ubiquitin-like 1-activating enzyme E1 B [Geosmithia morbida]